MMLLSRIKPAAGLLFLLVTGLLLQQPALAQETTGSVSGVVQDATGAIIPRASVVLTNVQNKTERKTVSNSSGNFTLASVASGGTPSLKGTLAGVNLWVLVRI